jgi:hypothetical protein
VSVWSVESMWLIPNILGIVGTPFLISGVMGPSNEGLSRKMTGLRALRDPGTLNQFYLPWGR